ncbi:MAG: GAF domain-containing sensor histidine kinase [Deltaproteobacteria bacterium]|nr:GAF domain-containing sensor histidine kinase [Deltaproteobacteria bacterium]
MVAFLTATTYAIIRYRLMDIRLVMRRSFIFAGLALFVFFAYYATLWLDTKLFGGPYTSGAYLAALVITPIFLLAFSRLSRILKSVANKYFFAGLYDHQETIDTFASKVSKTIHLNEVVGVIIETIENTLRIDNIAVALRKPGDDGSFDPLEIHGFGRAELNQICRQKDLYSYFVLSQKPLVVDEFLKLDERTSDQAARITADLKRFGIAICLPLITKKRINSLVILGQKISREAYTKEDIELLMTLSHQAAVALENARLYADMQEVVDEQTKDIKEMNTRLQELLKMKSEFLTVASHQLRTPTSIVRGYLSMAVDDKDRMPSDQREMLIKNALAGVNRLERIIHDLLSVTELEGGMVLADEVRVKEAIRNLVDNAIRYTEKGHVSVALRAMQEDKKAEIIVEDTGIGMSDNDKKHLFGKFVRGEGVLQVHPDGTGLGLFITRQFIELMNGTVQAESAGKGKGSTFKITLPIAPKL